MDPNAYDALSEPQRDRIEDLGGKHPATHFDLIEVQADGTSVWEFEDLAGAGTLTIAANGEAEVSA
jgi:hypothetical protein